jgi:hypothetical protein
MCPLKALFARIRTSAMPRLGRLVITGFFSGDSVFGMNERDHSEMELWCGPSDRTFLSPYVTIGSSSSTSDPLTLAW